MKKNIFFTLLVLIILFPVISMAAPIKEYCNKNASAMNRSFKSCIKAETKAERWLAINPVSDDIFALCRRGSGDSRSLLQECVRRESYKRNARALNPLNLGNSRVWYAASLKEHFPALLRACGVETPLNDFAVLPRDITKFILSAKVTYKDILPVLALKGRVKIAALPSSMRAKKKRHGRSYDLYIDAFLISANGRVVDIASTGAAAPLFSTGGTASFSLDMGKGYYFDKGGTILVVASGAPITSAYPEASCLLLGAKKITIGH